MKKFFSEYLVDPKTKKMKLLRLYDDQSTWEAARRKNEHKVRPDGLIMEYYDATPPKDNSFTLKELFEHMCQGIKGQRKWLEVAPEK